MHGHHGHNDQSLARMAFGSNLLTAPQAAIVSDVLMQQILGILDGAANSNFCSINCSYDWQSLCLRRALHQWYAHGT
jgi:hypothetical protein